MAYRLVSSSNSKISSLGYSRVLAIIADLNKDSIIDSLRSNDFSLLGKNRQLLRQNYIAFW